MEGRVTNGSYMQVYPNKINVEGIHICWLFLGHILEGILKIKQEKLFQFPMDQKKRETIPLVKWKILEKTKVARSAGLKTNHIFKHALATKSLWRMMQMDCGEK